MRVRIVDVRNCLRTIAQEVNASIPAVNSGGCAVYATELAERLFHLGFSDVTLHTYGYDHSVNVCEVERNVFNRNPSECSEDWNDNGVDFIHVRLKWRRTLWDVEGDVPFSRAKFWNGHYSMLDGYVSFPAMKKLADNEYNWNDTFDRNHIPNMRLIMDRHFAALTA